MWENRYICIVLAVYLLDLFEFGVVLEGQTLNKSYFQWLEGEYFFSYILNIVGEVYFGLIGGLLGLIEPLLVVI